MTSPAPDPPEAHPLHGDRAELNEILDVMYACIQKVLGARGPGLRHEGASYGGGSKREPVLPGTGVSPDDVLSDAVEALLKYPPEKVRDGWKPLAVTIARNKAIRAHRKSQKGLAGTKHRTELHLVSGDETVASDDDDRTVFDLTPAEWESAEAEYFATADALKVLDLARTHLSERDQVVFFRIHFEGYKRKDVAAELELSPQRVGQIYDSALDKLEARPDYPFQPDSATDQGGQP